MSILRSYIYQEEPVKFEDYQPNALRVTVKYLIQSCKYEKIQWLLNNGHLTPQQFRDFKLLKVSPTFKYVLTDVCWLFIHIYPTRQDRDEDFVHYLVTNTATHSKTGVSFRLALELGLEASEIPSRVWIDVIKNQQFKYQHYVLSKLIELRVPFPSEQSIKVTLDDGTEVISSNKFIMRGLFPTPQYFKYGLTQVPNVKLTEYRKDLITWINRYADEPTLDLLFSLGFTERDLRVSSLFASMTTSGNLDLFHDWVRREVGVPYGNYKLFLYELRDCVSGEFWREVTTYLMVIGCHGTVTRGKIRTSKSLIRASVRLGFFTHQDWLEYLNNKNCGQSLKLSISQALESIN
jgi:hypothetical protein